MDDTSFGLWMTNGRVLTLSFDSASHPKQRYKGQINFKIKGNRFYQITFTKKQYQELKEKAEQSSNGDTADSKLPSFREFKKKYGKTMKNFNGKTGIQYFEKIKSIECKRTVANSDVYPSHPGHLTIN